MRLDRRCTLPEGPNRRRVQPITTADYNRATRRRRNSDTQIPFAIGVPPSTTSTAQYYELRNDENGEKIHSTLKGRRGLEPSHSVEAMHHRIGLARSRSTKSRNHLIERDEEQIRKVSSRRKYEKRKKENSKTETRRNDNCKSNNVVEERKGRRKIDDKREETRRGRIKKESRREKCSNDRKLSNLMSPVRNTRRASHPVPYLSPFYFDQFTNSCPNFSLSPPPPPPPKLLPTKQMERRERKRDVRGKKNKRASTKRKDNSNNIRSSGMSPVRNIRRSSYPVSNLSPCPFERFTNSCPNLSLSPPPPKLIPPPPGVSSHEDIRGEKKDGKREETRREKTKREIRREYTKNNKKQSDSMSPVKSRRRSSYTVSDLSPCSFERFSNSCPNLSLPPPPSKLPQAPRVVSSHVERRGGKRDSKEEEIKRESTKGKINENNKRSSSLSPVRRRRASHPVSDLSPCPFDRFTNSCPNLSLSPQPPELLLPEPLVVSHVERKGRKKDSKREESKREEAKTEDRRGKRNIGNKRSSSMSPVRNRRASYPVSPLSPCPIDRFSNSCPNLSLSPPPPKSLSPPPLVLSSIRRRNSNTGRNQRRKRTSFKSGRKEKGISPPHNIQEYTQKSIGELGDLSNDISLYDIHKKNCNYSMISHASKFNSKNDNDKKSTNNNQHQSIDSQLTTNIPEAFICNGTSDQEKDENNDKECDSTSCHDSLPEDSDDEQICEKKEGISGSVLNWKLNYCLDLAAQHEIKESSLISSTYGRAFLIVQKVQRIINSLQLQLICFDDMVWLIERFLEKRKEFHASGKDSSIIFGYHYTKPNCLENIKADGLLSRGEQHSRDKTVTKKSNLCFGNGIYISSNSQTFVKYGSIGLIVAALPGKAQRINRNGMNKLEHQSLDTGVGNKKFNNNQVKKDCKTFRFHDLTTHDHDEIVLRSSSQCLPLIMYQSESVTNKNGITARCIEDCTVALQKVLNDLFDSITD